MQIHGGQLSDPGEQITGGSLRESGSVTLKNQTTRSDVLNGGCQTSENRIWYITAVLNQKILELVKY